MEFTYSTIKGSYKIKLIRMGPRFVVTAWYKSWGSKKCRYHYRRIRMKKISPYVRGQLLDEAKIFLDPMEVWYTQGTTKRLVKR